MLRTIILVEQWIHAVNCFRIIRNNDRPWWPNYEEKCHLVQYKADITRKTNYSFIQLSLLVIFAETNKRMLWNEGYLPRAGEGRITYFTTRKFLLKQPPRRRRQNCNDYIKMESEKILVVIDFRHKRRRINYSRVVQLQTTQDAQSTLGPHYHFSPNTPI